jgi:hypothetical protein
MKMRVIDIRSLNKELQEKYHGCGNGFVTFSESGEVINFGYIDKKNKEISCQNVSMTNKCGENVVVNGVSSIRCNFSCMEIIFNEDL